MDKHALGEFLRSRRERVSPSDVGLPQGRRRRTPGLRREEVAQLAYISVDHYTRLEQARGRHPSRRVLDGISRALRLSDQERARLFQLAGEREESPAAGPVREVEPSLLTLLGRLTDAPAIVVDPTCRVLAWNPLAAALFEDFSALDGQERNVIRRYFLNPDHPDRPRYGVLDPERFVVTAVSYLRMAVTRYPDDPELRELVDELVAGSAEFARMWNSHEFRIDRHLRQTVHHPQAGPIELDFDILTVPEQEQQVVIFTAEPGSAAHRSLQQLAGAPYPYAFSARS
ncbi:putative DNA-binding protein [[Actinomadura] parvosata subsp. kistnae]|uniref:DNA-binding protein n=1 Tax=[Actinomadura] parvosata subsp. kistnae TaxID=1909395 RepID=A0A1V0AAR0_9ACTN|nr:helix-turn-helix transcriptional regulator [Nonomuraea sp. ATCC 55076]AQZ67314.1 DNA-binding protein [Nonomuraea sp. ATCC 55076]SPL94456.1 putative DNA-binding protein [Actinomadura parvosata subsp. kistnae]